MMQLYTIAHSTKKYLVVFMDDKYGTGRKKFLIYLNKCQDTRILNNLKTIGLNSSSPKRNPAVFKKVDKKLMKI